MKLTFKEYQQIQDLMNNHNRTKHVTCDEPSDDLEALESKSIVYISGKGVVDGRTTNLSYTVTDRAFRAYNRYYN